jgi:hypothetical protein
MAHSKLPVNHWRSEASSRDQLGYQLAFAKSAQEPDCGPGRVLYCEPGVLPLQAATPKDILGRHTAGQQLFRRLDLAVGHLAFAPAFTSELPRHFRPRPRAFYREVSLPFGQTGQDVQEKAADSCRGRAGQSPAGTGVTPEGAHYRLDGLTSPAGMTILEYVSPACVAHAYNGRGYDREGAHSCESEW